MRSVGGVKLFFYIGTVFFKLLINAFFTTPGSGEKDVLELIIITSKSDANNVKLARLTSEVKRR